jgi:hypothetical protein
MMKSGRRNNPQRCCSRPIPKRGQVKVGIVVGLANSVASIFSRGGGGGGRNTPRGCPH